MSSQHSLDVVAPLVFAVIIIAGWSLLAHAPGVEPWVLPSPEAVLTRVIDEVGHPQLWWALAVTAREAVLGCVLGTLVALPLAYAIYRSRIVAAAVEPFLGATQAIPAIALAPVLVLWVGYGLGAIVCLCTLMVFFPILVTTTLGLRHLDADILDAARLDGAGGWHMLSRIEAPLAASAILTGARGGFALSVTGAVVGEMVMGGTGLGTVLTVQRQNVDTTGMFVTIGLLCILAMSAYTILYAIERRWRHSITG